MRSLTNYFLYLTDKAGLRSSNTCCVFAVGACDHRVSHQPWWKFSNRMMSVFGEGGGAGLCSLLLKSQTSLRRVYHASRYCCCTTSSLPACADVSIQTLLPSSLIHLLLFRIAYWELSLGEVDHINYYCLNYKPPKDVKPFFFFFKLNKHRKLLQEIVLHITHIVAFGDKYNSRALQEAHKESLEVFFVWLFDIKP